MTEPTPVLTHRQFVERLIIALVVVGLALMIWQLRSVLILVFGAVLVSVIFRTIANPIRRRLHLPDGLALLIAVLLVLGLFVVAFGMFGTEAVRQASTLSETLPAAWQAIQGRLDSWGLAEPVNDWIEGLRGGGGGGGGVLSNLSGIAMSIGNALTDTLLVLVGGIFLAISPKLYRTGLIKLLPDTARGNAAQAMEDSWQALRLWLLGRLTAMAIVGLLTGIGLWLIGIPGALALGILAGLLDFIPFIGPFLAAAPALLLALAYDPVSALWVVALFLVIQQIEGNIVTPLVQQRAVDLPPALLLFSLVAAGLVFGIVGILFAEPLTVVLFVMVKRLYVREALHTDTPIPGETKD